MENTVDKELMRYAILLMLYTRDLEYDSAKMLIENNEIPKEVFNAYLLYTHRDASEFQYGLERQELKITSEKILSFYDNEGRKFKKKDIDGVDITGAIRKGDIVVKVSISAYSKENVPCVMLKNKEELYDLLLNMGNHSHIKRLDTVINDVLDSYISKGEEINEEVVEALAYTLYMAYIDSGLCNVKTNIRVKEKDLEKEADDMASVLTAALARKLIGETL